MTLDEIERIRSGDMSNILDLDECEMDFEVIDIFEDLSSSGERFIIGLQRQHTLKKYQLFIIGESWELYDDDDFEENPMNFEPLLSGNISTLKYRKKK